MDARRELLKTYMTAIDPYRSPDKPLFVTFLNIWDAAKEFEVNKALNLNRPFRLCSEAPVTLNV